MINKSRDYQTTQIPIAASPLFVSLHGDLAQCAIIAGSNHNADHNISAAIDALAKLRSVTVRRFTAPLQTPALDAAGMPAQQPDYTNLAILLSTTSDYPTLRASLRQIESSLGRTRYENNGESLCVIDLDIVIYVQPDASHWRYIYIDDDITKLPYIAVPLARLVPEWVHPEIGEPMATIADNFSNYFH